MEHFIRIVFWIVILSGGLQASPVPSDWNIDFMKTNVNCTSNSSTFYAPENVKDTCITTALDCVLRELETVKVECNDSEGYIDQAAESLTIVIEKWKNKHPLTNFSECACEKFPQFSFTKFLDKMKTLLQRTDTEATQ